jgi:hypothetical protein
MRVRVDPLLRTRVPQKARRTDVLGAPSTPVAGQLSPLADRHDGDAYSPCRIRQLQSVRNCEHRLDQFGKLEVVNEAPQTLYVAVGEVRIMRGSERASVRISYGCQGAVLVSIVMLRGTT